MKPSPHPVALKFAICSFCFAAWLAAAATLGPKPHQLRAPRKKVGAETRYLEFQVFTWSPDPEMAGFAREGTTLPTKASLLPFIRDIKTRIGTVGNSHDRLGFFLGPIGCFDQTDSQIAHFVKVGFDLAIETNMSVGFKIDDSMFWGNRKALWSNPKNVEAMDWNGTANTGRRLDWGKTPTEAPPQMCFNSPAIEREVRRRAAVFGHAIVAGIKRLNAAKKPMLFAGVIAGSETMIGQDYATGKYLGYRALMNLGFSREHQPKDKDLVLEAVVRNFIDLWTNGLAKAGVPATKIYSHTAFLSRRVFKLSDNNGVSYAEFNHFAPPSVAFGSNHRPGFSTYPQPGLFDDIYAQLAQHKQTGWASSEGTNLQLGAGPGHSGMNMETYLAKMFNHGATLVDVFSWGIGGDANRDNEFRQMTEGPEALNAYRKFLHGEPLIETSGETSTLLERLPKKIHKIQSELPGWLQRTGRQPEAQPLMTELESAIQAKDFDRAEKAADAILKLMAEPSPSANQDLTEEAKRKLRHEFGFSFLVYRDKVQAELGLNAEQKVALDKYLSGVAPADMAFLQTSDRRQGDFEAFRTKAREDLESFLKTIFSDAQSKRLGELVRQREGLFGGPSMWVGLDITEEEKAQFMAIIEPMSKKMEELFVQAEEKRDPANVQHEVLALRADLERQLEAVLTDTQRQQWKEMLGKPMPVDALFDLLGS